MVSNAGILEVAGCRISGEKVDYGGRKTGTFAEAGTTKR
jgi:hypothetical protein